MASNFSFQPFGLSQLVTVIASATTTSLSLVNMFGATATLAAGAGAYQATSVRLTNLGAAVAFVAFSPASTATIGLGNGMAILGTTTEKFGCRALLPFLISISAGTTTLAITLGEGR